MKCWMLASREGWVMGLQFENLIVKNAMSLVPDLHLGSYVPKGS